MRLLELPIWELTAGASERLMKGEELEDTMKWMDQEAAEEKGRMVMDKNSTGIKEEDCHGGCFGGRCAQHSDFLIHP